MNETAKVLQTRVLAKASLKDKRVLIRVDFNVPLSHGKITDLTRIRSAIPTIKYILSKKAKRVILVSHLGRPNGKDPSCSLSVLVGALSKLLKVKVQLLDSLDDSKCKQRVVLLENIRYFPQEEANDPVFAKQLASLCDVYVNDAFGTAHRAHASTAGICSYVKGYIGLLMQQELHELSKVKKPKKPLISIIGFAKISDKIALLETILKLSDVVLIGGAVAFTFAKAKGYQTGTSLVEDSTIVLCHQLLQKYAKKIVLPVDVICAKSPEDYIQNTVQFDSIPFDQCGYDIGPQTVALFSQYIKKAKTVFWNGPLGLFEVPPFNTSTIALAKVLAKSTAISVIGGGDTVSAIEQSGYAKKMSHISTGGGASLAFIERELEAIVALSKSQ
jgi:phosphoglycerate kinase